MTSPPTVDDVGFATLDALFRQRMQEVRQALPNLIDVAEMVAVISAAATRERDRVSKGESPNNLESVAVCLQAVLRFLEKQASLMERGDLQPLLRLHGALSDLTSGKPSDLLKPVRRLGVKGGSAGDGITYKFTKAMAARALSEFIDAGENITHAAGRIARALKAGRRDIGHVNAATIVNWRERFEQGPGPGAQADAVEQYRMPVPGDTPKERGEALLKALARRAGIIG